jgi:predicted MFS family arabinose efflux permease
VSELSSAQLNLCQRDLSKGMASERHGTIALGLSLGNALGAGVGTAIGAITGDLPFWLGMGIGLGSAVGTAMGISFTRNGESGPTNTAERPDSA